MLEIAVGTGRNLPYYFDEVHLTGIELAPAMLDIDRWRAAEFSRPADLRLGDAQALDFEDECFDTIVCTLSLCTIPNDRAAVAKAWRVLRPGGRFVLLEHVRSARLLVRLGQQLLEPLFLHFDGDHLLREPLDQLQAAGFEIGATRAIQTRDRRTSGGTQAAPRVELVHPTIVKPERCGRRACYRWCTPPGVGYETES